MIFHELTARRIAALDRHNVVVVIPFAAVEQHGPHMPTGTDTILCSAVAEALEARRPDRVLLTPTVWLGASAHHLRFGATLDAQLSTCQAMLCDIGRSLLGDGFRRLLFLNGHGGNVDPLRVALRTLQPEYPDALLSGGSYWTVIEDLLADMLDGEHKFVGHACEFETSLMLHLRPELVDATCVASAGELVPDQLHGLFVSRDMRQRTSAGYTGRPDLATADKGRQFFEQIVCRLETVVDELIDQPTGVHYRDWYPHSPE